MERYSAMRRGDMLPLVATRVDLESIVLREISQVDKDENHLLSFTCGV